MSTTFLSGEGLVGVVGDAVRGDLTIVTPGDVITEEEGFMRGHGTYFSDGKLLASVAGVVERVNKVISVRPVRTRYVGDIGDVVVGRVIEVGQRRWLVDTQSRLDSLLKLSSVNLPGGVLRRKSASDELMMRSFFKEGDIISAEVQQIYQENGTLSLHTRSLKYGNLGPGIFMTVPPVLVRRSKNHFHTLPCGVAVVLGNNGYIWIGASLPDDTTKQKEEEQQAISDEMRWRMARVRNSIHALSRRMLSIFDTSIIYTYEDSESFEVKDMLTLDAVVTITARAMNLCLGQ
eukprot:m.241605 g.241605  ORF g.241605 m.241605 type:complete len:290 (-) comp23821_c0_seq1:55-924(-)